MWEIRQPGLWEADLGSLDGAVYLGMRTGSSEEGILYPEHLPKITVDRQCLTCLPNVEWSRTSGSDSEAIEMEEYNKHRKIRNWTSACCVPTPWP